MKKNILTVLTVILIFSTISGCDDPGEIVTETLKTKASITKGTTTAPVTWEDTYNEYSRSVAESIYESLNSTSVAENKRRIQAVTGDTGIRKPTVTTVPPVRSSITSDTSNTPYTKTAKNVTESSAFGISGINPVPADEVLWKKGAVISDDNSDSWYDN